MTGSAKSWVSGVGVTCSITIAGMWCSIRWRRTSGCTRESRRGRELSARSRTGGGVDGGGGGAQRGRRPRGRGGIASAQRRPPPCRAVRLLGGVGTSEAVPAGRRVGALRGAGHAIRTRDVGPYGAGRRLGSAPLPTGDRAGGGGRPVGEGGARSPLAGGG